MSTVLSLLNCKIKSQIELVNLFFYKGHKLNKGGGGLLAHSFPNGPTILYMEQAAFPINIESYKIVWHLQVGQRGLGNFFMHKLTS